MLPTLVKIGPVPIHSYGLMIAIGFLVGLYIIQRDAQKMMGIDPRVISDMAFWTLLTGIAGTRILHIVMFSSQYSWSDPVGWVAIWKGGLVFQGAVVLPIFYNWYATRKYKLNFWKLADIVMPCVPLGHAFGRLGCFLNGCCYGSRTDMPWGIPFRRVPWDLAKTATGSPAYLDHCHQYAELSLIRDHWSYPVHPTQLYGVIGLTAAFLLLVYLRKKWHPFDGFTFPLYFIMYGVGRLLVEFLRGDHNPTIGPLTQQQVFSLAFAVAGVLLFFVLRQLSAKKARL